MTLQDHMTINELIKFYQKNRNESDYKKGVQPIEGHKIESLMMTNYIQGRKLDLNIY